MNPSDCITPILLTPAVVINLLWGPILSIGGNLETLHDMDQKYLRYHTLTTLQPKWKVTLLHALPRMTTRNRTFFVFALYCGTPWTRNHACSRPWLSFIGWSRQFCFCRFLSKYLLVTVMIWTLREQEKLRFPTEQLEIQELCLFLFIYVAVSAHYQNRYHNSDIVQ